MAAQTYTIVAPTDAAIPPPPGIIPTFQDPFSLRPYHNVTAGLGLTLAGFFILLRIYTKARVVREFKWEDYTCILAFLLYIPWAVMEVEVVNAKGGAHQWNVTKQEMMTQRQFTNYHDILYGPCVCLAKVSILLLVLRIFCPQVRDPCYWVLQSLNAVNIAFYVIFLFISIFLCNPRQKIWNQDLPGKCLNMKATYIASSVFNALSDIAMFFVPLWRIWHLNISRSRKLGISGIFSCGFFAILFSLIRLAFCVILVKTEDWSYVKAQSSISTHGEIAFGLICSCLFVLPRLYRHLAAIPPYGSDEYHEYQRRKSSTQGGWERTGSRSWGGGRGLGWGSKSGRGRADMEDSLGDVKTDIERPPMPNKSWLQSTTNGDESDVRSEDSRPIRSGSTNTEDTTRESGKSDVLAYYINNVKKGIAGAGKGGGGGSQGVGGGQEGQEMSPLETNVRFGGKGIGDVGYPMARKGIYEPGNGAPKAVGTVGRSSNEGGRVRYL